MKGREEERNKDKKTYTNSRLGALAAQLGHLDAKFCLVGGWAAAGSIIVGPRNQGGADDSVGRGVDDADVGVALVGNADPDLHVENVARLVALDIGRVVGELVALAEPEVALFGVVAARQAARVGSQKRFGVGSVVVLVKTRHDLATCRLGGRTRLPCCRLLDQAVGRRLSDEGGEAEQGCETEVHCSL